MTNDDLGAIRRQLDYLAHARLGIALTAATAALYEGLCRRELELIESSRNAV